LKKCRKELYCQFLLAAQTNFTATDFANHVDNTHHDAITRFLKTTKLTPTILWEYTHQLLSTNGGYLICDDTVLDHWYGKKIGLARWQYSGAHHDVVFGIGVVTLLWTGDTKEHIPFDFRIYAKGDDGKSKNQHFRDMLKRAQQKGFRPKAVLMDSWYAVSATLHLINNYSWTFVCGLASNRTVATGRGRENHYKLKDLDIPKEGRVLHLQKFGQVKVFCFIATNGKTDYLATNNLNFSLEDIQTVYARRWEIEEYHRGMKQTVGVAKCQARGKRSQRTHIFCSILSFVALEKKRLEENISWYEAKRRIISDALFAYLKQPMIKLPTTSF